MSFRITAFKADDIDDVFPVTYALASHLPSEYQINVVSIQRHRYLRDQLEVIFTTSEKELNEFYSKQLELTISGTDHETTKTDVVTIVLCPR